MKAIMISIRPQWVAKILNGEKTIEIRKTCPEIFKHLKSYEGCSIDVYIYCTKQDANYYIKNKIYNSMINGKVVAKFTLNKVEEILFDLDEKEWFTDTLEEKELLKQSCLSQEKLDQYLGNRTGYAWHIDNLVIFDKPKNVGEFKRYNAKSYPLSALPKTREKYKEFNSVEDFNKYVLRVIKAPQSWCYIEV